MCVVSMVMDHYEEKWGNRKYWTGGHPYPIVPIEVNPITPDELPITITPDITREEFDKLKEEVQELKELMKRAKQYDEDNDQPDCENDRKFEKLKKIAELVDIDLDEVFNG